MFVLHNIINYFEIKPIDIYKSGIWYKLLNNVQRMFVSYC